jgi:DNA-binding NarL/FixJ family response regulator
LPETRAETERWQADEGSGMPLFGRDHELRAALALLDGFGARGLIISGEPGIGKTAIWRELLHHARAGGFDVLRAMPSGAEVQLTFAALGDLVDDLGPAALARLAPPQRRALEVALLRAEGTVADERAVSVALLELLRNAAAQRPLLIGIDDLQWLDAPSAGALSFALRRLGVRPVFVAATLRGGDEPVLDLDLALGADQIERFELGPLTLAAIHELIVARTQVEPPRATLLALFDAAGGNPFMAGELARELKRRGTSVESGELPPLPPSVRQLVSARISRLAPEVQELLLAAAGLARPTLDLLARLRPDAKATLRPAVEAGVIDVAASRGGVRFTHPLLARVPYEALAPEQRRRLHARLAAVLDATEPSAAVAGGLDEAAAAAGARGAPARAAELCLLAARLTPAGAAADRARRTVAAAEWLHREGQPARAEALAEGLSDSGEGDGDTRARALSLLGMVRADTESAAAAIRLYDAARREPGVSLRTRGEVHRRLAWLQIIAGDTALAVRHARAALVCATEGNEAGAAGAQAIAGLATVIGGGAPPDGLVEVARAPGALATRPDEWAETSPGIVAAVTLLWAGEIEQARPPLEAALAVATARDEPWLVMHALSYLSAIAIAAGELDLGLSHARRYEELARATDQGAQRAASMWSLSVALVWQGRERQAREAVVEGLALASGSGHALYEVGCLGALGLLELSLERGPEAVQALTDAREGAAERGVRALGRLPLLPDSVEALTLAGQLPAAAEAATEVRRRADTIGAPWALALAARCDGLVAEAAGDSDRAIAALTQALAEDARQTRRGERARTELALGRSLRRGHHKRAARETLERAAAEFEAIGAELWAQRARRELARIGGRAASAEGELSATEQSIAELVAAGRTNQEVAAALHLSARTVEWNLSKVYRKLGVRGRTELAAAFAGQARPED